MIRYTASRPNINTGAVDINAAFRQKREKALNSIHRNGKRKLKNYRRDGDVNTDDATRKIFNMIERAADGGQVCPTNREIADMLNVRSVGTPSMKISMLEAAGLIAVTRFGNSRIIEIVATGRKTIPMHTTYPPPHEVKK